MTEPRKPRPRYPSDSKPRPRTARHKVQVVLDPETEAAVIAAAAADGVAVSAWARMAIWQRLEFDITKLD